MLILPIHEAKAGAKLAMSVMHPKQREQELLKAGFVLEDAVIARLKSLEVHQIFVDFPGLDDLDKYVAASLSPERKVVFQQVKEAISANERSTRPVVKYDGYLDATREFVKTILANPQNAVLLDVLHGAADEVSHATGVAHLALVLGLKLDAYLIKERPRLAPAQAKDVSGLGVAGMLHDIGKTKLPPELRKFNSTHLPPIEADRIEWEKHAQLGYDIVHGNVESTTAAAVLHHHQRFDGNGFPQLKRDQGTLKLSGGQIHVFARILAAADLFERLATLPDGKRRPNYQVLHWIKTQYASWLDPEVLNTLPQVIPPFSPGRRVTLSDGTEALITGFHPFTPYQPVLKRYDAKTQQLHSEAIDLRSSPLKIEALDSVPLTQLESPPTPTPAGSDPAAQQSA